MENELIKKENKTLKRERELVKNLGRHRLSPPWPSYFSCSHHEKAMNVTVKANFNPITAKWRGRERSFSQRKLKLKISKGK